MRVSTLFSQTLRQAPADADTKSHQFLLRAGFIRQLAAGIFSYLPLGLRSVRKIEEIIRHEMNAINGQEIAMPVVHPADLWKETGRWQHIGPELVRFQDRAERDMVLAMTHEEVVSDLVRNEIRSYRQLPQLIYQFQTKFRDEPRPRAGLIRVREFIMKDSYSLDADWGGLDIQYRRHYQAYFNIFNRCGLPVIAVRSDVGMMGGSMAHEFMYLNPIGEDILLISDSFADSAESGGYAANREVAQFAKPLAEPEAALPLEKIGTPGTTTIEALANFLGVPKSKTAKAVFMIATIHENDQVTERFVLVIIRGDMDVNETKLTNVLKAKTIRPAIDAEIRAVGVVPGYGSAIGISGALVVVDDAIPDSPNLVAGANQEGFHWKNTNYGRDYQAAVVADIAAARDGDLARDGAGILHAVRGVEVANIFKLGTRYSEALGCTYLDKNGDAKPVIMGSYGIGVGRLLACVAEQHNDENGLIWPINIAPYHVHLILIAGDEPTTLAADDLYSQLTRSGVEVLYDDRNERPGVKFKDADLIGLPLRITIGAKSLAQGGVEIKQRTERENQLVPLAETLAVIQSEIRALHEKLNATVVEMPFRE